MFFFPPLVWSSRIHSTSKYWLTHSGPTTSMSRTPGETHPTLVNSFSPDFHSLSSDFTEPTIPAHLANLGKHTHTTLGHSLSPDEYWIHEYLVVKTRATSTAGTERVKHTLQEPAVITTMANLQSGLPFKKHRVFTANSMTECKPVKTTKAINLTRRETVTNARTWGKGTSA